MVITPRQDGSLNPHDANIIVTCYNDMKNYYIRRDNVYNSLLVKD